ncbi:12340_t:CDS:2, partial [Funneliformis geosporum]
IPFMAIENEGSTERINGTYRYVLRLYSRLINGQKALVTLIDIQVFFDILVPDGKTLDECEEKVARKNGIQLSGWSTINKYICKKEDFTTISNRFSISVLLRDRTLILTWDIETYASQIGEFAEVLEQKNKVFMIGMILHWKDDPKPLKQICLVDVETASDSRWVTIICGNQIWKRMTGKFETKEEILKWKYHGKVSAKSENNFMIKGKKKDTDEEGTIWGSGEEVEKKKDYMEAIKIKITAEEDFFS